MGSLQNHSHVDGQHFLVLEDGRPAYVSLPQEFSVSTDEAELCFTDHKKEAVSSDICCPQEQGHVHAHVHHGEITQDILLEQCMEESGCTLPLLRELKGICQTVLPLEDLEHEHMEGCGHSKIAHGDHFDWLVPLKDGSFQLSHQQILDGCSSIIEHGRLINRGKTLAKLQHRPKQLVDLFSYESPKHKGYTSLSQTEKDDAVSKENIAENVKRQLDESCTLKPTRSVGRNVVQGGMVKIDIPDAFKGAGLCKTTLDVMGICCPSEVPLIKRLLSPLPGVEEVSVNVTSKTVIVLHDQILVTDVQLVKALNEARLDASIHQRGELKAGRKWPSPWCLGSGVLVAIAFFHYIYSPMQWVALGAVAIGIPPLIVKAIAALRKLVLDINILMLIAVGGSIGMGDYLEAGTIVFLFTLADWLESRSTDKARTAIAAVVDRAPQSAVLLDGGNRVRVEDVEVGTLLAVKAGETIPIDGEVVSGKSTVDESSLTGESVPVEKDAGATVWAGTMNMSGYVTMKTTALSVDSAVARMVRLVEEAQKQRSNTEMLVEKIAKYYTPAIVIAAVVIAVVPWASGVHNPKHWLYLALVLLVVACPCALVISTPVVVTCGIAQAAHLGLLIKGGTYLEILGRLKVVALDKTGTLSEGHFRVSDVLAVDGVSSIKDILYWLTSVESQASHPLAAALVSYARIHGVEPSDNVTDFEIIPGEGVSGVVDGHTIQIGNTRMANRLGWDTVASLETMEKWSSFGATVGWIGVDGNAIGIYSVGDQLRPEAPEAVRKLKKLGIQIAMLTGDSSAAAAYVHTKIGDIDIHADLLPEDKVRIVSELKVNGVIAMVGDGINDAPALAAADVGIAMGVAGSAVAMETADVALMTNDLRKLAVAVQLGQRCRWVIGQNVTFSFFTKIFIIGLAAGGYASLWAAVVADVGTCLIVIFNSMRLLKKGKKHAGHGDCVAKQLDKKHTHGKSCREKDGEDDHCLEGSDVEAAEVQSPVVTHKHKGLFPWLHEHRHHHNHHHHHHHEKKKEDPCCKDKEDHSVPCCTSARCEQKVLTSRGKGHRHSHLFGTSFGIGNKKKGLTNDVELCSSQCCSDPTPAPTVQPNCGSYSKCCLPETPKSIAVAPPHQKSGALELGADCCSKVAHEETIPVVEKSKAKTGGGCCVKGKCKPSEAPVIASSANTPRCCSNGECKDSASDFCKDTALTGAVDCCATGTGKTSQVCKSSKTTRELSKDTVAVAPPHQKSGALELGADCCSKVAHEETIPVVEKSKAKTGGGCCVKGKCKPSEAPVIASSANTPRCCSNGECKDSASDFCKDTALTGAVDCCATGTGKTSQVCKSSKTTREASKDTVAVDHKSASGKSSMRCCADVKCKSLQDEAKVLPDTLPVNKPEDAATMGTCCADSSSCKSCVAPSG